MVSFTFATARSTPLPPYRLSSRSRSSSASCAPVDAPDGTMARPKAPSARVISASTVGFPRESSTSRARTSAIRVIAAIVAASACAASQRALRPVSNDPDQSRDEQCDDHHGEDAVEAGSPSPAHAPDRRENDADFQEAQPADDDSLK